MSSQTAVCLPALHRPHFYVKWSNHLLLISQFQPCGSNPGTQDRRYSPWAHWTHTHTHYTQTHNGHAKATQSIQAIVHLCLSFCPSVFLNFFLCFCLSFFLSVLSFFPSFFLFLLFFLSFCLSFSLCFCLSFFLSFLSLCASVFLFIFLSLFLSFCLSFSLCFCLSFFLSVLSFFLSFCASVLLSLFLPSAVPPQTVWEKLCASALEGAVAGADYGKSKLHWVHGNQHLHNVWPSFPGSFFQKNASVCI